MTARHRARSVILLFVDGVGVGRRDPAVNPFARLDRTLLGRFLDEFPESPTPRTLTNILRADAPPGNTRPDLRRAQTDILPADAPPGSTRMEMRLAMDVPAARLPFGGSWRPVDATLGVPGLPQSATGQATILTGRNVPMIVGGHVSAVPDRRVRSVLENGNLFGVLLRAGLRPTFANAYTPAFFTRRRPHISVTTRSMMAAGLGLRRIEDLVAGRAVYHDYTNRFLIAPPRPALAGRARTRAANSGSHQGRGDAPTTTAGAGLGHDIRERSAEEAAEILFALSREHEFVLHEHFLTDLAGHRGDEAEREEAAKRIEALVEALAARAASEEVLFLAVSDHGNLEDGSTRLHTMNPVPLLAWGPGAEETTRAASDLTSVTPAVLAALGVALGRPDPA